ncbi:hypothetical protein ACFQV4_01600 [Streptomyces thermocarboxydus]
MPAARRQEAHALIARNAERMSRLVDDLFLLARLGDSAPAHREPVDLLSLTADAIATTAIRHPDRSITLEPLETPEPRAPPRISPWWRPRATRTNSPRSSATC